MALCTKPPKNVQITCTIIILDCSTPHPVGWHFGIFYMDNNVTNVKWMGQWCLLPQRKTMEEKTSFYCNKKKYLIVTAKCLEILW